MSWETLRSLVAAGWEIGSHTVSHASLPTLDDDELRRELVASRQQCARMTGTDCHSLAVPYGDCDPRVAATSREAGYSALATIPWRLGSPDGFVWPRVGIYADDGLGAFRLKVSRLTRRVRSSPVSAPLAPLVRGVRGGLQDGRSSRDECGELPPAVGRRDKPAAAGHH